MRDLDKMEEDDEEDKEGGGPIQQENASIRKPNTNLVTEKVIE